MITRMLLTLTAAILIAHPSAAVPKWKCGAWKKESATKDCRTCTRTVCDTKGDSISNCRNETKKECSVPAPAPKAGASGLFDDRAIGSMQAPKASTGGYVGDPRGKALGSGDATRILERSPTPGDTRSPRSRAAAGSSIGRGALGLGQGGLGLSRETCENFGGSTHGPGDSWVCCFELGERDGMCYGCKGETPGGGENCKCLSGSCKESLSGPAQQTLDPSRPSVLGRTRIDSITRYGAASPGGSDATPKVRGTRDLRNPPEVREGTRRVRDLRKPGAHPKEQVREVDRGTQRTRDYRDGAPWPIQETKDWSDTTSRTRDYRGRTGDQTDGLETKRDNRDTSEGSKRTRDYRKPPGPEWPTVD